MTRDQHHAILTFLDSALSGDLPAMDVEADAIIRAYFKKNPDAAYRVTMLAMTQPACAPAPSPSPTKSWLTALFERRIPAATAQA